MKLEWWKWPFWIKIAGQGLLFYGVWLVARAMTSGLRPSRSELIPWLISGLLLYYTGRGLQIAAKSRERRLAAEAKKREDS